jgi:hypothetical protein
MATPEEMKAFAEAVQIPELEKSLKEMTPEMRLGAMIVMASVTLYASKAGYKPVCRWMKTYASAREVEDQIARLARK